MVYQKQNYVGCVFELENTVFKVTHHLVIFSHDTF